MSGPLAPAAEHGQRVLPASMSPANAGRGAMLISRDGDEIVLEPDFVIGRAAGSDLRLDDATVSRRHAVLRIDEGRWTVEDCGSFNGIFVNGSRLAQRLPAPLRHGDRLGVGRCRFVFCWPDQPREDDRTHGYSEEARTAEPLLSAFQLQVVRCLCAAWLVDGNAARLPSNVEIARSLGTPEATETVKAALRRAYAKAGLTNLPPHVKRARLCAIARQRGWV
jgi:pSer/pThr/pTyr-binding forkhead associated (FHA) protein